MVDPVQNPGASGALADGLVVGEKYRLRERLGQGAMGSVYRAEHLTLGSPVAIKFLHDAVAADQQSRARFVREAKLAANLGETSRHIARVIDYGVMGDGTPYLVMELLRGEPLDALVARSGRVAPELVGRIAVQLCRALSVAHEAGVVHRDLKPANVFLCREEDPLGAAGHDDAGGLLVKLLDFGVAKALLDNEAFMTSRKGALIGSPNYMSPEQMLDGSKVDARSDLWAAAVVVYRMLTGKPPFGRGSLQELAIRILSEEPVPPRQLVAELPPGIDGWMKLALAKKPENRFQDARAFAESLTDALAVEPPTEPSPAPRPVPVATSTPGPASATVRDPRPEPGPMSASIDGPPGSLVPGLSSWKRRLLVVIGVVALLVIVGVALLDHLR